jgi:hypothetical protein
MGEPDEMGYPLEDPADSRPCGCEETEALKTERDMFRDLARHRGDLLVGAVERQLLAERRLAEATALLRQWWQAKAGDEQGMPFFETGAFLGHPPPEPTLLERIEAECNDFEQADAAHQGPSPRVTIQRIADLVRSHKAGS